MPPIFNSTVAASPHSLAQNEQVERVEIKAAPGKANQYFLVAVSDKEFEVPLVWLIGII